MHISTDMQNGIKNKETETGCDRSAEDAYSSMTPDPTFAFVDGTCCRTLDFVFAFGSMITLV
jgi:hypothetical protein